jgi:acetolactate synthase regulatory subunit
MPALTAPPRTRRGTRRLELTTNGDPDALPRVLVWLRRRGCTITLLDYAPEDRHGPGRFVVCVEAPPRHEDRLARGLEALVDVIAVAVE